MKNFFFLIVFMCVSCSTPVNEQNLNDAELTIPLNNPLGFADVKLDSCVITSLELDTTTELQNQYFVSERELLGFKTESFHVTSGDGEMGFLILSKDGQYFICLVDGQDEYKIIGTIPIPSLKKDEQFIESCQSSCQGYFKTFGVVKEVSYGDVRTITAWRVNDKKRIIEQINPNAINCRTSFYSDYD